MFARTRLADVSEILPVHRPLSDLKLSNLDLAIFVNGFEDRSLAVAAQMVDDHVVVKEAVFLKYSTNGVDNARNRLALLTALQSLGATITEIDVEAHSDRFLSQFSPVLEGLTAGSAVLFDCSSASSFVTLRVMRSLFDQARASRRPFSLVIAYAPASQYLPTLEQWQASKTEYTQGDLSTIGLDFDAVEQRRFIEYEGQHIDHLPDRVVMICGFNSDRVRAALDSVDSALNFELKHPSVEYISGVPVAEADAWRHEAMIEVNSRGYEGLLESHPVSTLDYRATLEVLEGIYEKSAGAERLTIFPFGSKMQTLAVALHCEIHADVRACVVAPARYNGAAYSMGAGMPLGLLIEDVLVLSDVLGSVGNLSYVRMLGSQADTSSLP